MKHLYSMFRRALCILAFCGILLICSRQSMSLVEISANSPLSPEAAQNYPMGVDKVANLSTRRGKWSWGGPPIGWAPTYEYKCKDTEEFQKALDIFAAIRSPKLEVVVHEGVCEYKYLKEEGETIWTMTVWRPGNWHRIYSDPTKGYLSKPELRGKPVPAPRLDLYLGSGVVDWKKVKVPKNITVIDKRAQSTKYKPEKGALFYGEVNDMESGRPIAGAKVWIREYDSEARKYIDKEPITETNEMGEYKLEVVAPDGYYEICFSKEGYAERTEKCSLSGQLQAEERVVELVTESWIDGMVVDTEGKPVPDVRVEVRDLLGLDGCPYRSPGYNPPFGMTDSRGYFEIKSLPLGYTHLYATKPGLHFKYQKEFYKIPSDYERKVGELLGVKIVAEGTGTIHGKVVEIDAKANGQQVYINIESLDNGNTWGGTTPCNKDGEFEFKEVPSGRYKLSTQPLLPGIGDDPNAKIVTVSIGTSLNIEVKYSTSRDLVR